MRQLPQQVLAGEVAARSGNLVSQRLRLGEVLEQGDNVREGFMKRQHVGIARFGEIPVQAVEQRVGFLVRDHVMRQTREHQPARQVFSRVGEHRGEVAEQQRFLLGTVIGVCLAQGVGINAQLVHGLRRFELTRLGIVDNVWRPQRPPAQGTLELVDGHH